MRRIALILTLSFLPTFLYIPPARADVRDKIIQIAISELGRGETTGDNRGADVRKYLNGDEGKSWCSGFVSYVLNKAGVEDFGYELMARNYLNKAHKLGWDTSNPQRGDLIVFWRESRNSYKGHIGIIESVDQNFIYTIEGNTGDYPSKVKRLKHNKNENHILGYVRIKKT